MLRGRLERRRGATLVGLGAALFAASLMAAAQPAVPTHAQGVEIAIEGFAFRPGTLTVPAGTTITWRNHDQAPHTATADVSGFDSRTLGTGEAFSFTATEGGAFAYSCTIHPFMRATLTVTAAAAAAPTASAPTAPTAPAAGGSGATPSPAPQTAPTAAAPAAPTASGAVVSGATPSPAPQTTPAAAEPAPQRPTVAPGESEPTAGPTTVAAATAADKDDSDDSAATIAVVGGIVAIIIIGGGGLWLRRRRAA